MFMSRICNNERSTMHNTNTILDIDLSLNHTTLKHILPIGNLVFFWDDLQNYKTIGPIQLGGPSKNKHHK